MTMRAKLKKQAACRRFHLIQINQMNQTELYVEAKGDRVRRLRHTIGFTLASILIVACGGSGNGEFPSKKPELKAMDPPKGMVAIWSIADLQAGVSGMEVRRFSYMTFNKKRVTGDFSGVLNNGVKKSRKSSPDEWGRWKLKQGELVIDWDGDGGYRSYELTMKTSPAGKNEKLNGCWSSFYGASLGFMGSGVGSMSAATNTWCFGKNGRFSNDRSVTVSGSGSGSSVGSAKGNTAGWYRIDGHMMQLVYDNGARANTTIGVLDQKNGKILIIGGGYFD